jgi:hypothetical protein
LTPEEPREIRQVVEGPVPLLPEIEILGRWAADAQVQERLCEASHEPVVQSVLGGGRVGPEARVERAFGIGGDPWIAVTPE